MGRQPKNGCSPRGRSADGRRITTSQMENSSNCSSRDGRQEMDVGNAEIDKEDERQEQMHHCEIDEDSIEEYDDEVEVIGKKDGSQLGIPNSKNAGKVSPKNNAVPDVSAPPHLKGGEDTQHKLMRASREKMLDAKSLLNPYKEAYYDKTHEKSTTKLSSSSNLPSSSSSSLSSSSKLSSSSSSIPLIKKRQLHSNNNNNIHNSTNLPPPLPSSSSSCHSSSCHSSSCLSSSCLSSPISYDMDDSLTSSSSSSNHNSSSSSSFSSSSSSSAVIPNNDLESNSNDQNLQSSPSSSPAASYRLLRRSSSASLSGKKGGLFFSGKSSSSKDLSSSDVGLDKKRKSITDDGKVKVDNVLDSDGHLISYMNASELAEQISSILYSVNEQIGSKNIKISQKIFQ